MEFVFRVVVPGEPDGQIELTRLHAFTQRFQAAIFRSAQAELNIPAFRRKLGDEPRPRYRLSGLGEGSTRLSISSVDERPLSVTAVTRHLGAIGDYRTNGRWPETFYQGELEAWATFYEGLLGRADRAFVEVETAGQPVRVDQVISTALREARPEPVYRRVTCIGALHMIEVEREPKFRINTEEADLVFDLPDDALLVVDPLRWQRVRAEALWQVGTRRARLFGAIEPTDEPAGISIEEEVAFPAWVTDQVERIGQLGQLRDGWSGPLSKAVRPNSASAAAELARRISSQFGDQIPEGSSPFFFPNEDGNVEFEWRVGPRELVVELVRGGYDILASRRQDDLYEGPVNQQTLFAWIRWLLTGEDQPA